MFSKERSGLSPVLAPALPPDRPREHPQSPATRIEFIQRRIGMLDFVLSHPQWNYFETEAEKVSFFCNQLKVPNHFLPSKIYRGQKTSQPTLRYFVDKFPMFLGDETSSTVATLTYLQGQAANFRIQTQN
jgi:hypothetical protein